MTEQTILTKEWNLSAIQLNFPRYGMFLDDDGNSNDGDNFHFTPVLNNKFRKHHLQTWGHIHWPKECYNCCFWKTW